MRELRTGMNTELYSKLAGELGPQFDTSPGWAEETDRKARQTQVPRARQATSRGRGAALSHRLPPRAAPRRPAPSPTSHDNTVRQERLEGELNHNKSNLVKESIRQGYNELGQYHYSRGDLNQAMKFYVRTRDYCTSNRHMAEMCVRLSVVP